MTRTQAVESARLSDKTGAMATLNETMDEAIAALTAFDADRLEAIQDQVRGLTTQFLARQIAGGDEALPDLLRKHTLLGEMLNATAANLKVISAVVEAKRGGLRAGASGGNSVADQDRSNFISWPR